MVSTFIYWAVFAALAAWGLWSLVFSCVYLSNHENGNLWFFAIINAILGLLGWLFAWIMSNTAWQQYWFASKVQPSAWFTYLLIGYLALIVLQVILGREKKVQAA